MDNRTRSNNAHQVIPAGSSPTLLPALDSSPETARKLRNRSLVNLSRMGHCAPTVMQTILDASDTEAPWLVKLTAGLPGGIGYTRSECGGITAPLVLLGLRYGMGTVDRGLPLVVYKGHDLLRRFSQRHHTRLCSEILGQARLPLRCIGVIRVAPELYAQTLSSECLEAIPREAYCRLYTHLGENRFHCAHAVFQGLGSTIPTSPQLLAASSGFIGGTVFTGMTCSAFTAGVMALGLKLGEIENSRLRVLRMIATMAVGGDAFADDINKFNKIMNLGHQLSRWFTDEFGSTQCRVITQCDFSSTAGVSQYIEGGCMTRCKAIAAKVAVKVQEMLEETQANHGIRVASQTRSLSSETVAQAQTQVSRSRRLL
jgi:C_GCAxxG_C_C family probable redox protein